MQSERLCAPDVLGGQRFCLAQDCILMRAGHNVQVINFPLLCSKSVESHKKLCTLHGFLKHRKSFLMKNFNTYELNSNGFVELAKRENLNHYTVNLMALKHL